MTFCENGESPGVTVDKLCEMGIDFNGHKLCPYHKYKDRSTVDIWWEWWMGIDLKVTVDIFKITKMSKVSGDHLKNKNE